jgi:hypothetical protein
MLVTESIALPASSMRNVKDRKQVARLSLRPCPCGAGQAADGVLPMNLYHDVSGWTLVFAVLVCAVICDAFGIWMGWLSTH